MTIEEKAKAYDEALEKTRTYRDNARIVEDYVAVARYENIFPELRESEDERIRKTLVEYFGPKVQLDFVRGVPIQKIRDWLEKQKDHFRDDTKMVEQMLEWAKEKYEEYDRRIAGFPDDGAYWGQRNAFRQMIDKLNSI